MCTEWPLIKGRQWVGCTAFTHKGIILLHKFRGKKQLYNRSEIWTGTWKGIWICTYKDVENGTV